MSTRNWLVLGLVAGIAACTGSDSEPLGTADAGEPDSSAPDAGADAEGCPSGGSGMLAVEVQIEAEVPVNVQVTGAGTTRTLSAAETLTLPAGLYQISAKRVMKAGVQVGAAYQPSLQTAEVCVRADLPASARVVYTREPGSARMWLTQTNGDGAQVMAFDADQLMAAGDQTPSVGLETKQPNAGPIRVDALGRLWVGSTTGTLVAFDTARLATASSQPPDVIIDGPAICGSSIHCGPRALAFDKAGALWVAVLDRIVKLEPESLMVSGKPAAAITITSPEIGAPDGLAFDGEGNLWVAESDGGVLKFAASRLGANIVEGASDVAIYAQQPGPVKSGLRAPRGLAFDPDGNLWVGYWAGNDLVRFPPSQLAVSHLEADPIIPDDPDYIKIGVLALVSDLAIDQAGNLWLPSRAGEVARIDRAQLSAPVPTVVKLRSAEMGSVERLTLHSVSDDLFIAP